MPVVQHAEAMAVLEGWEGRDVLVVAYVQPGFSLRPMAGPLTCEREDKGTVRASVGGQRIVFPRGLFHEAGWVPGQDGRGLSVVQGATRVDVFLEE